MEGTRNRHPVGVSEDCVNAAAKQDLEGLPLRGNPLFFPSTMFSLSGVHLLFFPLAPFLCLPRTLFIFPSTEVQHLFSPWGVSTLGAGREADEAPELQRAQRRRWRDAKAASSPCPSWPSFRAASSRGDENNQKLSQNLRSDVAVVGVIVVIVSRSPSWPIFLTAASRDEESIPDG